ncbi:MAG: hypothetical protein U0Y10_21255 [Spirosomataceae bacterium]
MVFLLLVVLIVFGLYVYNEETKKKALFNQQLLENQRKSAELLAQINDKLDQLLDKRNA